MLKLAHFALISIVLAAPVAYGATVAIGDPKVQTVVAKKWPDAPDGVKAALSSPVICTMTIGELAAFEDPAAAAAQGFSRDGSTGGFQVAVPCAELVTFLDGATACEVTAQRPTGWAAPQAGGGKPPCPTE